MNASAITPHSNSIMTPSLIEHALASLPQNCHSRLKVLGTGRNHLHFTDPHPHQVANFGEDFLAADQEYRLTKVKVGDLNATFYFRDNEDKDSKKSEIEKLLREDVEAEQEEKKLFFEE